MPAFTRSAIAPTVSSIGTFGSTRCWYHRSMWSTPRRLSEPSKARFALAGEPSTPSIAYNLLDGDPVVSAIDGTSPRDDLAADPNLPDDTRLWAALQRVGGGTWGGCVYDVDAIVERLRCERGV